MNHAENPKSKNRRESAYLRIKNAILANIHAGLWTAGSAIPSEMQLAKEFGVARMTVNRALKELSAEKILERRQGSGTFVAQQKFNHAFIEIRNIASDIRQAQQDYRALVLQNAILPPEALPAVLQSAFSSPEASVFSLHIVHFADNIPIQYEERWVDLSLIPRFAEQDFTQINPSEFLIQNIPLERGEYRISAEIAPANIAQALQMEALLPALLLTRQTWSRGRVVSRVNMWHCGARYHFSGHL